MRRPRAGRPARPGSSPSPAFKPAGAAEEGGQSPAERPRFVLASAASPCRLVLRFGNSFRLLQGIGSYNGGFWTCFLYRNPGVLHREIVGWARRRVAANRIHLAAAQPDPPPPAVQRSFALGHEEGRNVRLVGMPQSPRSRPPG